MATSIETLIELLKNLPDYGRVSYVVTAKGDEVKTAFDIVDASALLVSNTLDGKINPDYPQELQPRDRTRASSLLQVNQISKDLRPAQLTDSGLSSHGAPIIGEDNAVESGNGRTMGIIKAYQDGNADRYREYLIEHATEFGIRPEKVESMTAPVLVRRRLTKVDRVQFAKDSNISDLQEMAASEKAFVDADSITPAMMALFNPSESGDLLSRSNNAFIRGFMTQVGATQAAGLVTEDGRPTRQLVDRIQNAIFAKAYKDARLVRMVAEEPDPDMRNVLTALNAAANDFVQMQALSGEAHKQAVTTIVDGIETADSLDKKALAALKDAVDLVRQSKESGQHITDVIAQGDMFSETAPEVKALALFIVANNRSAKRMATAFKLMAQRINDELQHQGQALGDMFGGGDVSLQDILRQVSQELENEGMQGISGGLFESVSGGSYNGVAPYTSLLLHRASGIKDIIHLIVQLTRRSVFLTIFGLFEHRMVDCLALMDDLSSKTTDKTRKTIEDCHKRLKRNFGGKSIKDVDHLAVIRNIMAHSDGVAEDYKTLSCKKTKKTEYEKPFLRAIPRAMAENAGVSINMFNDILMDDRFLMYAVGEFERYVNELNTAVRTYQSRLT